MRIGDLLIESGFISEQELKAALQHQRASAKTPIGELLKLLKVLKEDELELVLQAQRKMLFSSMSGELAIASMKYAKQHKISFAQATQRVLENTAEHKSEADDPKAREKTVDPEFLISQSDKSASLQNWDEAIGLLEQARAISERAGRFDQQSIIPVYCRLSALYSKTGRTDKAGEIISKVSDLIQKGIALSPGSVALLAASANLCSKQGLAVNANQLYQTIMPKWAELLPFELQQFNLCLRDAIECSRRVKSPQRQNIRIGELLINAGLIKADQFQDALQETKRSRQPLGRVLSQSKLLSMVDLRNAMRVQLLCRAAVLPGEYASQTLRAASYAKTSSDEFFQKLNIPLGSDEKDADSLALLISKMDSLLLLEESHGLQHPEVAELANELGDMCLSRLEYEDAEAMFRRAHAVFAVAGDVYQLDLANACQKLGRLLIRSKKYPEAELLLLQSMEIKSRTLGETHAEFAEVLVDVGYLYFCQASFDAAIGFLRTSWMIQQEDSSASQKRYVLELLIKCFEQSGQGAEADVYREQLRAIRRSEAG